MLKTKGLLLLKLAGLLLLGVILVYAIVQPVFPSGFIIKKMADAIDPRNLPAEPTLVMRFELSGKGGGAYSIVAGRKGVETIEGPLDRADLILFMEAGDFNRLMFSMATGRADEYTFKKLAISKVLRFAGDMTVFETVFKAAKKGP